MKNLQQFMFEESHNRGVHGIFEMSQISDDVDELPDNMEVWVYSECHSSNRKPEASYSEKDEQGTKPPHFHVKLDNGRFEFEIKLDDINTLNVWRSKTIKYDWSGYKKAKKRLRHWLKEPNSEEKEKTNWEVILIEWNRQNKSHKINKETYMRLL